MTSKRSTLTSGLTRLSLDRRITVFVLFVSVLVVGLVAASGIPLELVPQGYSDPFLGVTVPWRDAPAAEVEQKLTLPLEEELSTVKGLAGISSWSTNGVVRCWMRFKQGTDMDVAYREVRDRIERARLQFPSDVERVYIRKEDTSGIPVAVLGLAIDPDMTDAYDLIQKQIVLPLERIDGVASVSADGLEEKEILIELDRNRVESAGLNIYDLAMQLGDDNFTLASGTVHDGARKLLLRSVATFSSVDELGARPVANGYRLRDLGTITYDEPEKNYRARVFGRPAVALLVFKEGQANTMEVSARVNEVFEQIQDDPRLQTFEMVSLFNSGDVIMESLSTLLDSGKIGGLFALLVLFSFLRRFRLTAIITLSIPLSIVIGLTVMYFSGETLNLLSLLGLMICVGLLVDNAVVVAENIHRLHREGHSPREACLRGAGEIALAITTATLTTIVVFLPVALVDGPAQFFLMRLALPVSVSLMASLFVALIFIPLAVYLTLPREGARTAEGPWHRLHDRTNRFLKTAYDRTLEPLNAAYARALGLFLNRRLDLVLVLVLVAAGTIAAVQQSELKMTEVQDEERSGFEIDVEFPADTTLEEAGAWFEKAEKEVEARREELGLDGYFVFHRATWGELEGWFKSPRTTDLSPREVTRIIADALPEKAGIKLYTGLESEIEEAKGQETHVVVLNGDDYETLEEVGEGLSELLVGVDGVLGLKRSSDRAPSELALVVDREQARRHNVNPTVVAGLVGYALRGTNLPRFRAEGREIPVRIRFREEDRTGIENLSSFYVPTEDGTALPLSAVTDDEVVESFRGIFRRDKRVTRTITLELEEGREEETRERLEAFMASVDLPEGVVRGSSARSSNDEDFAAMGFAAILSVIFIYLLMGFLFESLVLPLSILLTIPLASIGVAWIHVLTGLDVDFLGLVGAILLIGVVVNNGIVLIDYVSRLRHQGMDRREALLQAAYRRFRPIMMTALTTVCGTIPLTIGGANSIGLSYTSFGLTLIGGMTTGTLMTLLVVPVFYTLIEDGRDAAQRTARRTLRRWQGGLEAPLADDPAS